ncbi:MAG: alpha/beta fold hydrolase [Thermoplasmata archaeon]
MHHSTEGEFVTVGNGRVFHRFSNAKDEMESIILVHGWSYTSSDWDKADLFSRLSSMGISVYAPDYPGFGESPSNDKYAISRGNIEKGPAFISDYMESIGVKKAHILGASMGGGMAILSALSQPELHDSVIAAAPAWIENRKEDLGKIKLPVLFIWGSGDRTVPVALAKEYSELCKVSVLKIIEGAGHPVYLEKPEEFFRIISEFLDGVRKRD